MKTIITSSSEDFSTSSQTCVVDTDNNSPIRIRVTEPISSFYFPTTVNPATLEPYKMTEYEICNNCSNSTVKYDLDCYHRCPYCKNHL